MTGLVLQFRWMNLFFFCFMFTDVSLELLVVTSGNSKASYRFSESASPFLPWKTAVFGNHLKRRGADFGPQYKVADMTFSNDRRCICDCAFFSSGEELIDLYENVGRCWAWLFTSREQYGWKERVGEINPWLLTVCLHNPQAVCCVWSLYDHQQAIHAPSQYFCL